MIETEVLVVGAGPAGAIAAKTIAQQNVSVLIIDKKSEIGTPKRCAEGIIKSTLDELDIIPDKYWITREINGIEIVAPKNQILSLDDENFDMPDSAYILERKVFDKHMVMDAIRAGAKTMVKTEAYNVKRTEEGFEVIASSMGHDIIIKTRILIAADGPESRVARMAGLKTNTKLKNMASCIQYEMVNVNTSINNHVKIHIGTICPGGYIWIFPKGDDIANVGLGILKSHTDKTAKHYLDSFIENSDDLKNAQIVEMNVGGDPIGGLINQRYDDNILVIGDAAGFVDPLTGDGIRTAMLSGKYAGMVASKAIKSDDCSKRLLKEYYEVTEEEIGKNFKIFNKVKEFLLTLDDDSLNKIIEEIIRSDLNDFNVKSLLKIIIKSSPKSILKLGKLL